MKFYKLITNYNKNFYFCLLFLLFCIQINMVYAQPSLKEALKTFGDCLCADRDKLEVRDLKDFYRVRGVPATCCQSLAATLLPNDLTKSIKGVDNSNCRINAFFIKDNVFDPHTTLLILYPMLCMVATHK
jgi:hypothetical protein